MTSFSIDVSIFSNDLEEELDLWTLSTNCNIVELQCDLHTP